MTFLVGCIPNLPWWRLQHMTIEAIERYNRGFLVEIDMPNPGAERPLRKCTLNLFEEDCVEYERMYGQGWTTRIREDMHERLKRLKWAGDYLEQCKTIQRTLGDLE